MVTRAPRALELPARPNGGLTANGRRLNRRRSPRLRL